MATINKTVLITDSTRGIGLALVEHFLRLAGTSSAPRAPAATRKRYR
ncbi:NAD(P)-binding domain [Phytophthora cactorum]|nr:NAD(P)-binding domain [Phytophthora cactorum]